MKAELIREKIRICRTAGLTISEVASELGIGRGTVVRYSKGLKLPAHARKTGPKRINRDVVEALAPSEELAYFFGVFSGDGSLYRCGRTYRCEITCDARYPKLVSAYSQLMRSLFSRRVRFVDRRPAINCIRVYVDWVELPVVLGISPGDKKENGYRVPQWIFSKDVYRQKFLRGLIETDGNVYYEKRKSGVYKKVCFTNTNRHIMAACKHTGRLSGFRFRGKGIRAIISKKAEVEKFVRMTGIEKSLEFDYS